MGADEEETGKTGGAPQVLGRLLDPEALEGRPGPRGRLDLDLPAAWCGPGAAIVAEVPGRLTCARCEGGGCDACGRSGCVRTGSGEGPRPLRLELPPRLDRRVALRVVRPFGDAETELDQLIVELRPAPAASPGVRRIAPLAARPPREPRSPSAGRAPVGSRPFALRGRAVDAALFFGVLIALAAGVLALISRAAP